MVKLQRYAATPHQVALAPLDVATARASASSGSSCAASAPWAVGCVLALLVRHAAPLGVLLRAQGRAGQMRPTGGANEYAALN